MKKIKIMLMSLLLVSVVGGALAFKAKFINDYCTTLPRIAGSVLFCFNTLGGALTCPSTIENSTTTNSGQAFPVCTTNLQLGKNPCPTTLECGNAVQLLKKDL